jgi:hypothetical protein
LIGKYRTSTPTPPSSCDEAALGSDNKPNEQICQRCDRPRKPRPLISDNTITLYIDQSSRAWADLYDKEGLPFVPHLVFDVAATHVHCFKTNIKWYAKFAFTLFSSFTPLLVAII